MTAWWWLTVHIVYIYLVTSKLPFDPFGIHDSLGASWGRGVTSARAFHLANFILGMLIMLLHGNDAVQRGRLVVVAILVRRRGRVGWRRQGDVVGEHGNELVVHVQPVETVGGGVRHHGTVVGAPDVIKEERCVKEGDGVACRTPVRAPPCRREVEELVNP